MEKETIGISDLPTAAYLITQKFILVETRFKGRRALFHFEKTPEIQTEIANFINSRTKVDALEFYRSFRLLKNLIFQRSS